MTSASTRNVAAWAVAIAASAAACADRPPTLPVNPPSGDTAPVAGTAVHGVSGLGSNLLIVSGRVCLITADPRALTKCASTGADGLVVTLAGATTTTLSDGVFSLAAPIATNNLVFNVSGSGVIASSQAFSVNNVIPVIQRDVFNQILAQNNLALPVGAGSIFATVVDRFGNPVAGVTATSTPSSASPPLFDGVTPTTFGQSQTGQMGIVFFPGLTTNGPTSLTFSDLTSGQETTVGGVQVFDGGLTFVEAPLP
jgi:hypothetical protein